MRAIRREDPEVVLGREYQIPSFRALFLAGELIGQENNRNNFIEQKITEEKNEKAIKIEKNLIGWVRSK